MFIALTSDGLLAAVVADKAFDDMAALTVDCFTSDDFS
jgi:hypothetical protein